MVRTSNRSLQHLYAFTMLLFSVHFNTGVGDVGIQCIERERQALLRIKHDLIDDYDVLSSWTTAEDRRDCCIWRGIACDNRTSHVTELHLHFNETADKPLRGKINHSLLELRHLTYLDLRGNNFGGTQFPADKNGSLSKLRYLDLTNANFAGTISSVLANLSSLHQNIIQLDLSHNLLQSSTPAEIGHLVSLEILNLSNTSLVGSVPKSLGNMSHLRSLHLSRNNLKMQLPDLIQNLSGSTEKSLEELYLYGNEITGPLPNFTNFSSLRIIDLHNNSLKETIDKSIGLLSKLQVLHLGLNSLHGRTIRTLIYLDLSNNLFSGVIPDHLMHMQDLIFLNLGNNNLSGKVPTSIGWLSNLETLNLGNNALSGELPLSLKNCSGLRFIDLSGNKLSGNIPTWIGERLISLQYLSLQSNQFHGAIGRNYGCDKNLGRFRIINLSRNKIGGEIPREISSLSQLNQLNLSNNKLAGAIPEEIGCLKQLESLDLSQNQLSGRLPASLAELNFLNTLNLSNNNLSGRIPSSTQLQSFNESAFSDNLALCGSPLPQKWRRILEIVLCRNGDRIHRRLLGSFRHFTVKIQALGQNARLGLCQNSGLHEKLATEIP
uniref:Leucine-rich repeat-containing N-terminal plant-type domain-containing protein n=1 Tax=Manihot esculenta TaxID=3983 RepID=A0A2C9WEX0_MANES